MTDTKSVKAIMIELLMELNIIDSVPENLTPYVPKIHEAEIPIIIE